MCRKLPGQMLARCVGRVSKLFSVYSFVFGFGRGRGGERLKIDTLLFPPFQSSSNSPPFPLQSPPTLLQSSSISHLIPLLIPCLPTPTLNTKVEFIHITNLYFFSLFQVSVRSLIGFVARGGGVVERNLGGERQVRIEVFLCIIFTGVAG